MFAWLGIAQFKEDFVGRDNDISVFVGSALGITVEIGKNPFNSLRAALPKNLDKYPFLIALAPRGSKQAADYLAQHAHVLAWRLSHEGFRCFVPKNHALTLQSEDDGIIYANSQSSTPDNETTHNPRHGH